MYKFLVFLVLIASVGKINCWEPYGVSGRRLSAGCLHGQYRDTTTGECVSCLTGEEFDTSINECVEIVRRRNVYSYVSVDGCPDGTVTNDKGECVPIGFRREARPDVFYAGCIAGQTRDTVTGECVSCPPGKQFDTSRNKCVTIVIVNRRNVYPYVSVDGCPDGTVRDDKGECVPIGLRREARPDGFSAGCIAGQTRNTKTGECVSCPPGQEFDTSINECVVIVNRRADWKKMAARAINKIGDMLINKLTGNNTESSGRRQGVFSAGCLSGQYRNTITGECVSCPPGQEFDASTNECVVLVNRRGFVTKIAGKLFMKIGKMVVKKWIGNNIKQALSSASCLHGQFRNSSTGECVSCPPGQERDSSRDKCVTIAIVNRRNVYPYVLVDGCPDGTVRDDEGECVPIGFRREATPDIFSAGCIAGQTRNTKTGECVSCPPGQEFDTSINECVVIVNRRAYWKKMVVKAIKKIRKKLINKLMGNNTESSGRRQGVFSAGCLSGQYRDSITGECVSCPPGQEFDASINECVVIVNRRAFWKTMAVKAFKKIGEKLISKLMGNNTESSGRRQGVFSAGCLSGQYRDTITGECVSCPPGQEFDASINECVVLVDADMGSK